MQKNNFTYKIIGTIVIVFAILTGSICIFISIFAQMNTIEIPLEESSEIFSILLYLLLFIALIIMIIEKYTNFKFNRKVLISIIIPLTAIMGSLYSFLYIYYSMGYTVIDGLYVNNQLNFLSLFFFVIYTIMYNGFLIDWWNNLNNIVYKIFMLILLEIPNFISWWILAFSAPLNYIERINSTEHIWLTLTFALTVVLLLLGIRLIKSDALVKS
ncbi:hypothetical protein [Bacillus sp. FJAT-29937]|uniref:hypothetical protein n=1 Tax=Bacillus sp. FJAT-29937 TaxID=1720553 RepID=UPI00082A2403|nr:hypothetical protein [Bacillus sp. FJAT-29937]